MLISYIQIKLKDLKHNGDLYTDFTFKIQLSSKNKTLYCTFVGMLAGFTADLIKKKFLADFLLANPHQQNCVLHILLLDSINININDAEAPNWLKVTGQ